MLKQFRNILISAVALSSLALGGSPAINSQTEPIAHAYNLDKDKIVYKDDITPAKTTNASDNSGFLVNPIVPKNSVGAVVHWNAGNEKSQIQEAYNRTSEAQITIGDAILHQGSIVGSFADTWNIPSGNDTDKGNYYKWSKDVPVMELKVGHAYRITNIGYTNRGQELDMIWTPTKLAGPWSFDDQSSVTAQGTKIPIFGEHNKKYRWAKPGVAITHTKKINGDIYDAISFYTSGYQEIQANVDFVLHDTETPVRITAATYFADIDGQQGIKESFTNQEMYINPTAVGISNKPYPKNQDGEDEVIDSGKYYNGIQTLRIDDENKTVYSNHPNNADGFKSMNASGYVGVGTTTGFSITYYNPYNLAENHGMNELPASGHKWDWDGVGVVYRYDLFGEFNNLKTPGSVLDIRKSVTDADENDDQTNSLGLHENNNENPSYKNYTYNVELHISKGTRYHSLNMTDHLPKEVVYDSVRIYNSAGKDLTDLFNINFDSGSNTVTADLKESEYENQDLFDTTLTAKIKVMSTNKLGSGDIFNDASWNDGQFTYDTNKTTTHTPTPPKAKKEVSTDGGNTFVSADSPESAAQLAKRTSSYVWKNTFTLSNYTNFNKLVLVDHLETLQTLDKNHLSDVVRVYDAAGRDVTDKGTITASDNGGQTDVKWTASDDYLKNGLNKEFGRGSAAIPSFTMKITTNIKNATDAQESKYYDSSKKRVIIPNKSEFTEGDVTGDITTNTNTSYVTPPNPGKPTVAKAVAVDGTDPTQDVGWSDHLSLNNHEQKYSYRTKFQLSKDFNFDGGNLILTDHFENIQSYKSVRIYDAKGFDITSDFDITTTKKGNTTDFIATVKSSAADKYDDIAPTIYMVIDGVTLKGATVDQELGYAEPMKGAVTGFDQDPYVKGITIPNISSLDEKSAINDYQQHQDTNHTYVNFFVDQAIAKYVESEQNADDINDPNHSGSDTDKSMNDALAEANLAIKNADKVDPLTSAQADAYNALVKVLNNHNASVSEIVNATKALNDAMKVSK